MTIREIRFDGLSPVAVLDNGMFDTFDARRFDAVVSDARHGVIDLDNTFHIELEELEDDFDLRIDFNGLTSTVYVGY